MISCHTSVKINNLSCFKSCSCGALTHATKDCFERKRSVPAKFSNKHIEADDMLYDPKVGTFDSKRDRWNGYDS